MSEINKKLEIIISQTNYNNNTALNELNKYNGDYIKVIRNYLKKDIIETDTNIDADAEQQCYCSNINKNVLGQTHNKSPLTLNQEIFKQFRQKFSSQIQEI